MPYLQFTHGRKSLSGTDENLKSWLLYFDDKDTVLVEACGAVVFLSGSWGAGNILRLTPVDGEGLYYFRGVFYTEAVITDDRRAQAEECCPLRETRVYDAIKNSIRESEAWLPTIAEYRADAVKLYELINELHPIKGCVKDRGIDTALAEVRWLLRRKISCPGGTREPVRLTAQPCSCGNDHVDIHAYFTALVQESAQHKEAGMYFCQCSECGKRSGGRLTPTDAEKEWNAMQQTATRGELRHERV